VSPKKIGPIGTSTGGLDVLETDGERVQMLTALLAPNASGWANSGLPAMGHPSGARIGLAAAPGPVKVHLV
jgi:hypothetical protein